MAIVEVKVPQLSESVSEATMLQWKKKPGEAVAQDEILIELETDKVVLEVPAPAAGVLAQVLQNDGDTVVADQLIATIDTEAKAGAAEAAAGAAEVKPAAAPAAAAPAAQPVAAAATASSTTASPAASKLLAEKGLSAGDVAGSGRDGRVTKGDALAAGSAPKAAPAAAPAKTAAAKPSLPEVKVPASAATWLNDRPEQRVPMSRLRARIAERLLESQQTNAILTTFNEVNMAPVMELRNKYKDKFEKEHGVKLGFMSFFVKAAVHALKKFPLVNASIDGNDIVYHGYFDIGIAVGSPRGLVVPILRNADQLSLAEIEKKIAEFGQKAKDGKLSIEEMTGGTFSISNGGVFGSMLSTPIINPPQSAILGVHATKERPVVENGQIVIRPINYLALSYDHRIIDGREAVLSLVAMKDALEDPARLLLDL
ncbi:MULTISPECIES: 2-oxoglutarate dehydrogenase complex dihydrolipoyllysine-residue succinyltransferase [Burkholderia]|jgi:2-oxoglutarate dehydrogenase E2 component (dihydrolipoamide succinyltransferase)|uniref:Dihydrolipoyllysine-residue succinyltransferase component of 2-oxoglutarate dehydrogenase complex n=3 Tax=Burkholderia TaxID=32008 RepID=A0A1E3FUX7_9BURK|nr:MULTISPECIES: 2-oxoglutarate dehydrogenase complex dihydrolipoyllysine-residue succinyltransferase [Burkholderia]UTP23932.1 2-oxoglutarate dehydrogenase complex dihydrolipoyllysine-residue succinyltransferase [Burkholderia sp. FXe9]KKL40429.1 dihydrolipoamide succinyltransferase [Burkholderia contaminans LMG 23361]MBA9835219.1 2-oxoglutarate dehydrogenase complex dihydrolipoyllysine-residue succinyltransferase [Burkholderia contaminans]MBA9843121.1 2-oxoglutarate dehydrogenase complex dihydr